MGHRGWEIERGVIDCRQNQATGRLQGFAPHLFLTGSKGNFVDSPLRSLSGFAKSSAHAGQVLQLQRDMFQDMRCVSAFPHPLQKSAAHTRTAVVFHQAGQQRGEAFVESGQCVGRVVLQFTDIHQGLNDSAVGPDIGTTQVRDPKDVNTFLVGHGWLCVGRSTIMVMSALCILAQSGADSADAVFGHGLA